MKMRIRATTKSTNPYSTHSYSHLLRSAQITRIFDPHKYHSFLPKSGSLDHKTIMKRMNVTKRDSNIKRKGASKSASDFESESENNIFSSRHEKIIKSEEANEEKVSERALR